MINSLHRINELAKKQKTVGLSVKELAEQKLLRKEYLKEIRGQVLNTFSNLSVVDSLGNDVTPEKLRLYKEQIK
ncbi:DUF896 domain-containing protein [Bacillus sp. JJ722]|uniref:DUF896 domain-containing protein n=1 Tax=Bacillus sp. JJ722 TaxID=3122973 RepID=UPI002FFECEB2